MIRAETWTHGAIFVMATLADFLRDLLEEGRVVHRARPGDPGEDRSGATDILARAFAIHRLDVAGPPIAFDFASALAAADLLRRATWFLVNRSEPDEVLGRELTIAPAPRSASEHLSADLMLRFLPQVHRRARSASPGDRLASLLADALRRWPLSGVLSDLDDGPDDLGDLGGHPGLRMLYAERLARHEKPGWRPGGAAMMDQVECVFRGLGKGNSPLLRQARPTAATAAEGVARG